MINGVEYITQIFNAADRERIGLLQDVDDIVIITKWCQL
jgi:hypothetical protein